MKIKRIISLILISILTLVLVAGCGNKKEVKKQLKEDVLSEAQKEVQSKNPLPEKSKSYTGFIKKIDGSKVVVDVQGAELEFIITDKTNLQKGNNPGTGKLEELKPKTEIKVLVQEDKALTVVYDIPKQPKEGDRI